MKVLQASYGGLGEDIAYDVVSAANGEFYMIGNTSSFGAGGYDILVIRMDASKKIVWSNTYGVSGNETIRKASPAADGGILITGQTTSFSNSRGDILCMKIKPDGSLQWTRTFGVGSSNGDLGSDIIQTSDGGYAISGILDVAGGVADGIVIRLDVGANQVWAKRFNSTIGEDGSSIIEVGNKLVATFDIELQMGLDYGFAISEIQTSNGTVLTTKRILSTSKGVFRPIIYKDFGTGYWISGHLISGSTYNQMEQVILKMNASYAINKVYKLIKNPLTNYFFTGFVPLKSGGFITCASEPIANGKGHIYKIDANGKVLFAKQIHASGKSSLNALTLANDKVITVGSDNTLGNADFYVADFDSTGKNDDLCNIDTPIVSVQTHPFTVSDYTWSSVKDQAFSNTVRSLTKATQTVAINALCSKDTCQAKAVVPDFIIPDTVCVNTPVTITNKTVGETTNYWNFCVAGLNTTPVGTNLGNISSVFSTPVFMDYAFDNGNYYGFVINHAPGGLVRLDYGNSLLNTPTVKNLGNFGGMLPVTNGSEGIQIVQNEGKWYAIIVGGYSLNTDKPRILKIEFGANLSNNTPIATNWGNVGNMDQPIDLHVFKEGSNWYGLTVNAENNSITRFNFTGSFSNTPTATNLGNIGNLAYPTGIYAINDNGFWRVFVVNGGNSTRTSGTFSLTRLDFGTSLLNMPTGINLGNPGGLLKHPRDITIMKSCGDIVGFVVNGHPSYKEIVKLDFQNDLSKIPAAVSLGNIGNISFPHSLSKLFRVDNDLFAFITNVDNNTITRLKFAGCSNGSIPNSSLRDPSAITYAVPGVYNINLTIDDGLPTQTSLCKQVVVVSPTVADFSYAQSGCSSLNIQFFGPANVGSVEWNFGDGSTSTANSPIHLFSKEGSYKVKLTINGRCPSSVEKTITINLLKADIITTSDTVICNNSTVPLRADSAVEYCWTPTTYLNNSAVRNPVANPLQNITYYLTSKTIGNNLVVNGNFDVGNSGFTSGYNYVSLNSTEGQYFVGANPNGWNNAFSNCNDHAGAGGMMLVNGSPQSGVAVWTQTITVVPNTMYEFSTWLQTLFSPNPAKLQFSINGNMLGNVITASASTCAWTRFNTDWNSGSNTTAVISVVNVNTAVNGNDFALDDISFAPVIYKYDSIKIAIDKPNIKANNDTSLCAVSSLQLNVTGGESYTWSPAAGLNNINISNPIATIKDTAVKYIVIGTNANGCTANDTVQIGILSAPAVILSNDTTICWESQLQLKASGGISYQWNPSTSLNNASIANPVASPKANTIYYVEVNGANGCSAKGSVQVKILPKSTITITKDTSVCAAAKVQLLAAGAVSYQWAPAASLSNANIANPIASPVIATQYKVTATDANKCKFIDSVTISTLALPVVQVSKDTAICKEGMAQLQASGGISYTWSPVLGLSNPASSNTLANPVVNTTYSVLVTGGNSCKASASVKVNLLPTPVIKMTKDTVICGSGTVQLQASGGAQYQWSPGIGLNNTAVNNPIASPSATTRYHVQVTDVKGCIAEDSVTLKILSPFFISVSKDTSVCVGSKAQLIAIGGISYQWSPAALLNNAALANPVANITATTKFKVTATNADKCTTTDSITVTALNLPTVVISKDTAICREGMASLQASGGGSYKWYPPQGLSNTTSSNTFATPSSGMLYNVDVIDANNCKATGSVKVSLLTAPLVKLSPDTTLCGVGSVVLQASGGVAYTWTPAVGLSDPISANPLTSPIVTTTYHVKVTGSNSCIADSSVTVKVVPPLVATISNDTAICSGKGVGLAVTGGAKYQWSPAIGLNNSMVANPVASPAVSTTYNVKITNADNCTDTKSVKISVWSLPVINISNDTLVCRLTNIPLQASGGVKYIWTPATALSNPTISNPVASPTASTIYKVQVTDGNNCVSVDSLSITVRPVPQFGLKDNKPTGCAGESIQLIAFGGDKYEWSPVVGLSDPHIASPSVQLQNNQVYTVVISESICKETASFTVPVSIIPAPPVIVSKSNDITCNTPTAQLTVSGNGNAYNWAPATGLSNPTISNPMASPAVATTYRVSMLNANGCTSYGSVDVKVLNNNDFRLYQMPNAFTPNGNGNNDCFGVSKWGATRIIFFEIYNRWGQVVFKGNNSHKCWDGTLNGISQASGNFIYKIKVETTCGLVERQGSVVLIR